MPTYSHGILQQLPNFHHQPPVPSDNVPIIHMAAVYILSASLALQYPRDDKQSQAVTCVKYFVNSDIPC